MSMVPGSPARSDVEDAFPEDAAAMKIQQAVKKISDKTSAEAAQHMKAQTDAVRLSQNLSLPSIRLSQNLSLPPKKKFSTVVDVDDAVSGSDISGSDISGSDNEGS